MDRHYIDKKFREELQGLEANPPVEAWLGIADALDGSSGTGRKFVLMRTAAAIAALVVASFSFWMVFLNDGFQDDTFVEQTIPEPMDALPSGRVSDAVSPGTLLANLSPIPLQPAYASVNLQPVVADESATLQQLRSHPASLSGYSQFTPADLKTQASGIPSRRTIADRNVSIQVEKTDHKSFNPILTLGAHFAPQYNYRTFFDKSGSDYKSIPFGALESQIYTFSAGLTANMALSPSWSIETGLHLNNMGQYIDGISAFRHPDYKSLYSENQFVITSLGGIRIHDTSRHFEDVSSYRIVNTKESLDPKIMDGLMKSDEGLTQVFQFVEVPLVFRYKVVGQNLNFHLKGGVSGSYLLSKDVFMGSDITRSPIGETYGIKQFNFSVMGGFAMQIPVTGRLSLNLEPTAQLFLQPFVLDGLRMGSVLPYNFSLHTGFSYRF